MNRPSIRIKKSSSDRADASPSGPIDAPPSTGGPLKETQFRLLWFNNIGYFIVANAVRFVYGWLVLDALNEGEREQGLVVFALGIPAVFLVLHAGMWADRLDRRRLLIGTQIATTLVMAGTAILVGSGQATLGWIVVAALLTGATTSVGQPVRASLVPALVPREKLFSAIAVNALAMTMSMILGPVVVERVGQRFGFEGAYWFMAILLAIGLLFVIRMRIPPIVERGPRRSVIVETREALAHIRADRSLRTLFMLLTMAGVTVNPAVMVTLQAFIKEQPGRDGGDAAPAFAMMGVGIAISSIFVMKKGDMSNKGAKFQMALMTGATMTALMGQTTDYWQLLPLTFCMGLAGGFYINMNQGLIQANTPQELMGRIMGLYTLIQAGFLPVGALLLGLIAAAIGSGTTITLAGLTALVFVVITYVRNRDLRQLT